MPPRSLTQRWYVEDGVLRVASEVTREIRNVDMLPVSRDERVRVADGLHYDRVSLEGARVYHANAETEEPSDEGVAPRDPDQTDAYDVDEVLVTAELMLPENAWGKAGRKLGDLLDRVVDAYHDAHGAMRRRLRPHLGELRAFHAARYALSASAAVIAVALTSVGVAFAMAAGGTDEEEAATILHDETLRQLSTQLALSRVPSVARDDAPAADLVFDETGNVVAGELAAAPGTDPEPEISERPARVTKAHRPHRRHRNRARHRR